ncbi:MAG: electron transport complex subunit E [Pygmaiobacter sp.]|nr:electron transport complex subunit E [Pygmaiobacter sp.]
MEKQSKKSNRLAVLTNGLLHENPSLRLVLGTCPTLAITTSVFNSLGMGLAATFVLIGSNMAVSACRKLIPDKVRIPAFITIIAGFVTVVMMLVQAFVPDLYDALGVYLPLIVVNCISLGRAEMFASKNPVIESALDGLGMGIGFTLTLTVMGFVRELLGAGTVLGFQVLPAKIEPFSILVSPPGGFFVFGVLMAVAIWLDQRKGKTVNADPEAAGCAGCANSTLCHGEGGKV